MINVDRSQLQSTYSSSSVLCGCCNEHNGRSAVENGDRKARRRRNFDVEDEDGSFGRIWAGEVSDLSCIHHCLPLLFLEAPITGAREGNESRPRAKRKMVVWLLTSLDCSSSPCVTPATREVLRHPINRSEKRSREATRMLAVGHGWSTQAAVRIAGDIGEGAGDSARRDEEHGEDRGRRRWRGRGHWRGHSLDSVQWGFKSALVDLTRAQVWL